MRSGFEFVPDEAGIADVTTGDDVADYLTEVAVAAAERVKARGPKGADFFEYGETVKAIPAQRGANIEAGVEVGSPGWHLTEYGTARISPRAPLRKGVSEVATFKEGQ